MSEKKSSPAQLLAELKRSVGLLERDETSAIDAPAPAAVNAATSKASPDDPDNPPLEPAASGSPLTESSIDLVDEHASDERTGEPAGPDGLSRSPVSSTPTTGASVSEALAAESPKESSSTPAAEGFQPAPAPAGPHTDRNNVGHNAQLENLFDRVSDLIGSEPGTPREKFKPLPPKSLEETGLAASEVERLVLKLLLSAGQLTGRQICAHIKLPFNIVEELLRELKTEQLIHFKGAAAMGDYEFAITERGRERARKYQDECTYYGAAPVVLKDYLAAMEAQSIAKQEATEADLKQAFADLLISPDMLDRLGPAVNSGRGMFLFGEPGNGKTSIAERVTSCFGSTIWIPRALGIQGEIVRLFDPGVHEEVVDQEGPGMFEGVRIDQRWVHIVRPTVVSGGELTMDMLEICQNRDTKVCEAPLQLKSNCGTLVIDDFGRQRMPVDELLNRWIVPLEKRYDFLNMPSGKKIQVPFDQLIVFSTNLEPKDLVDGAFLRRIPYKIEVGDPSEADFRKLFEIMSPIMGFELNCEAIDYLIAKHYHEAQRPFRACQPRDLLLQVRNYCTYKQTPRAMTPSAFDFAVENYFSVM